MSKAPPRVALRFSRSRGAAAIAAALAGLALAIYAMLDIAADPDRIVHGRGSIMMLGHGKVGIAMCGAVAIACVIAVRNHAWRLYARLPAVSLASDGIWFDPTVSRRAFVALADVAGAEVESVWVGPSIFSRKIDRLTILIPGPSATGGLYKPIQIGARFIEGGVDALRAFANALEAVRLSNPAQAT